MTEPDHLAPGRPSRELRAFFAEFERAGNHGDHEASASHFADVFLSADPNRVTAVDKQAFVDALPHRARLFAAIGVTGTRLVSLTETRLDDRHLLADTTWATRLDGGESLTLSSVFVLRREIGGLRIVFYLNRHDMMAVLTARAPAATETGSR